MKKKRIYRQIVKSCLTGKVVWIYRGPSREAARQAYWRACRKEIERVRRWGEHAARRVADVTRILTECTEGLPINAELTPQQKDAARQLRSIIKSAPECPREFYDHIMEERRRRAEDREIRRKMREREKK